MTKVTQSLLQDKLDQIELVTKSLSSAENQQVLDLLSHPGFTLLLGMMLAEKQGYMVQMLYQQAGDAESARQLGVLQGKAIGIDRIGQILLECLPEPTELGAD